MVPVNWNMFFQVELNVPLINLMVILVSHFILKHIDIKLECVKAKIIDAISIYKESKSCKEGDSYM